jgi:hypothetical protein
LSHRLAGFVNFFHLGINLVGRAGWHSSPAGEPNSPRSPEFPRPRSESSALVGLQPDRQTGPELINGGETFARLAAAWLSLSAPMKMYRCVQVRGNAQHLESELRPTCMPRSDAFPACVAAPERETVLSVTRVGVP